MADDIRPRTSSGTAALEQHAVDGLAPTAKPPLQNGPLNRRSMLCMGGAGTLAWLAPRNVQAAADLPGPTPVDRGSVSGGKVDFPSWRGAEDHPSKPPPAPLPPDQRVGFALVGLGRLALEQVLPAFAECRKARPVALVSGSPDKLKAVARQYGIDASSCHDYASFERLRNDATVRAVYVLLPNAMHREYTERAAAMGKHVLCEKPMATSSADGRAMVAACTRADVKLMVAYRCQYEPYNRRLQALVRSGQFGRAVAMHGINVQTAGANATQQWRHRKLMAGGGALPDIGIYPLNAARFITGEEPTQVFATTSSPAGDPRYAEVEETISFMLRFPSGFVLNAVASYGAREHKAQTVLMQKASAEMPNAYEYTGQRLVLGRREGDDRGEDQLVLERRNQFAAEIDHFATCILENRRPRTPGEEGVQDHVVMEALYRSAASGRPVSLAPVEGLDTTRGPMPDAL